MNQINQSSQRRFKEGSQFIYRNVPIEFRLTAQADKKEGPALPMMPYSDFFINSQIDFYKKR